ncbi:FkbM family methyltransferase [Telmatospirillum sp.]|uniref:FkbM family methyltransferase n=1 Tax=Telmatospirillum sp. TaxID=2079197 RepID=UPI00284B6EA1|nr:FkbM family methyltransferase [Telmatospirillum sp.]MDR3435661.1 FkbM family methyltransferase [Telmatospirillum sp.]
MVRYPRSVSLTEARMVSYAQNAEDVMIDRVFQKKAGFFIDVGAFHPIIDSVTKHFSLLGWRGINIEPNGGMVAELERDRPNEINLCCAVGRDKGETVFHRINVQQCSTTSANQFAQFDEELRNSSQGVTVPLRTLADICDEHVSGDIDFLKIDVEGSEQDVILGADWTRHRPRLLVIEATRTGTSEPDWAGWEPYLLSKDYLFQHFDGINRFYLRAEDQHLAPQLSVPTNYLDWYFSFRDMLQMQQLGETNQEIDRLGQSVV